MSAEADAEVYLKLESHQITGSFKLRGAMNKCLSLSKGDRSRPVVTASSGNHAGEIERQLERFDAVFVPVGGGGLISGIAGYFKARSPSVRIVGCQPQASRVMYESLAAGRILDLPSERTLPGGPRGGGGPD